MIDTTYEQDVFSKLNDLNDPTLTDGAGDITALNFESFLIELKNRTPCEIITTKLIKFVNTLGKNKSGGNNAISRLQYFINAYIQEIALKGSNADALQFIGNDHYSLVKGYSGTDDADLYFKANNGNTYTIDAKIFYSESSFFEQRQANKINFHNADYCLVYIINSKSWRFSRKADNYNDLCSAIVFSGSDPWLSELTLPKPLTLIRFFTEDLNSREFSKIYDKDVSRKVKYEFYE